MPTATATTPRRRARRPSNRTLLRGGLRWVLVVAAVAGLSRQPLTSALSDPANQHLLAVVPWVALIAVSERIRLHQGPPIHDRQTDGIIAVGLLGFAAITHTSVGPRLGADATL